MSHISKIETKIKDLRFLKKACEALQMGCIEAAEGKTLTLCGYGKGEEIEGCIMEIKTGSKYSIGIRKIGQNYEFVADWWAIETFTGQKQEEQFQCRVREAWRTGSSEKLFFLSFFFSLSFSCQSFLIDQI